MQRAPQHRAQIYFNLGNVQSKQGNPEAALVSYGSAIGAQRSFVDAYLNRANLKMRQQNFAGALEDYKSFVQLAPNHAQTPQVRRLILALEGQIEAQEATRLAEEAAERQRQIEAQAEAERQAREAERLAREEEERKRNLLDSVFNSLGTASTAPSTLGTGADTVIHDQTDPTIDF